MLVTHHQAAAAVTAAEDVGLDIPEEVRQAIAVRETVLAEGRAGVGRPLLPGTADAARKTVAAYGKALADHRYRTQAASEMAKSVDGSVVRAVADAAPGWLTELTHLYDAAAHRLTEDLTHVPDAVEQRDLTHVPNAIFTAWLRCEGAARHLDHIVQTRNRIATAGGEEPVRHRHLLAAVTFPTPGDGATWTRQHAPVLADWQDAMKRPVERWRHLIRHDGFDLVLAALGEVHQRAEVRDEWRHRAQTRHGRLLR